MYIPPIGERQEDQDHHVVVTDTLATEDANEIIIASIRVIETCDFVYSIFCGEIPWVAIAILALTTTYARKLVARAVLRHKR